MTDLANGLKTAVETAVTSHTAPAPSGEQPDMFAGERPALTPFEKRVQGQRGRPVGAMNKRTEYWANFILSRHQSPLVFLAELYSTPTAELAEEMGCKRAEAMHMRKSAAEALAPYVHQKMPTAVQVDQATAGLLIVGRIDPGSAAEATIRGLGLTLTPVGGVLAPEVEEDQGFGDEGEAASDPMSDGEKSDGEGNP